MENKNIELIGKTVDIKDFSKVIKDFNFHIYGRKNKNAGGFVHDFGTNFPKFNPLDASSYWTRYKEGSPFNYLKMTNPNGSPMYIHKQVEMVWVEDDTDIRIGAILDDGSLVVNCYSFKERLITRLGTVRGLKFYQKNII